MSYVVYHKETTRYLITKGRWWKYSYETPGAAKAALTRAVKKGLVKREDYDVMEEDHFHKCVEKFETKHNLLSGKPFLQPVNTPLCCDPSSETYWSM